MMEFLVYLDNLLFFNLTTVLITFHLLFALCFGIFYNSDSTLSYPPLLNTFTTFSIYILSVILILFGFSQDFTITSSNNQYFFNQNFQTLFLLFSAFVAFVTRDYLSARFINKYEYDIIFLFVIISSICLCFADDFLLIYLAVELQSLCFYVFATFHRKSEYCTEAGLKYFILGAILSGVLLFGFSFIYILFGSNSFEFLCSLTNNNHNFLMLSGLVFVLITLFFKIGAVPFHIWLCDIYEGSLTSVTIFFASAPKVILFSLIIKIYHFTFFNFSDFWYQFFIFSSIFSIFIGSFAALYQKRLKRLLAYSTISHTGFILAGLLSTNPEAIKSSIVYIVIYVILTIASFSFILSAIISNKNFPKYLGNWTSFAHKNFAFAAGLTLVIFSIAGIPPLAGFFSKFFVLMTVLLQEYYVFLITAVLISSIACFYYIRLIKTFFFIKASKKSLWISSNQTQNIDFFISIALFFNVLFFLRADLLLNFANATALLLF